MDDGDAWTNTIVFLFFGLIIVGAIFIVKFLGIDFFEGDEIKAYSAICKTKVDLNICDHPSASRPSTTVYKVSYGSQQVISDNGGLVNKYTDCTVKDRKNWKCKYEGNNGDFGFISGSFFRFFRMDKVESGTTRGLVEKIYYPSRLEYFNLDARGCEGLMYPICYIFTVITN